jgi:hypothetical protein
LLRRSRRWCAPGAGHSSTACAARSRQSSCSGRSPGSAGELARRLHEHLDVDTLEALELAAHDGRLQQMPGIGPRRAAMVRATLGRMLARTRPAGRPRAVEPEVDLLLDVDREYRRAAERGALPKIAPRRFNPSGEAWLPILHTERGDWRFTALFSNSALAHELGRVRDWVVVYFHQDSGPEGQRTIVTESRGLLAGRRVVRGREAECLGQPDPGAGFGGAGKVDQEHAAVGSSPKWVARRSRSTTSSSLSCRKSS